MSTGYLPLTVGGVVPTWCDEHQSHDLFELTVYTVNDEGAWPIGTYSTHEEEP